MLKNRNECHWEKEEFEDLVSTSLIALYESNISKLCYRVPRIIKPSDKDILNLRRLGCYFPPDDREILYGQVDIKNDGFIKEGAWAQKYSEADGSKIPGEYFRIVHVKKLNEPPPGLLNCNKLRYFKNQIIYSVTYFCATQKEGVHVQKSYVSVDMDGNIYDTYFRHPSTGEPWLLAIGRDNIFNIQTDTGWASAVMWFISDSRYLWNVTAKEIEAKSCFGVYPEQIKSLFYSRELPMTETGRKRPILHWVAAHQRRLKKGIDIDIEKHLRGINEFVYNGTKFIITRPLKKGMIND